MAMKLIRNPKKEKEMKLPRSQCDSIHFNCRQGWVGDMGPVMHCSRFHCAVSVTPSATV
jgi:hypothetical protein